MNIACYAMESHRIPAFADDDDDDDDDDDNDEISKSLH
jgi:hypothetical protein